LALFSRIEWVFAVLLLSVDAAMDGAIWRLSVAVAIVGFVVLQSARLLPVLNRRIAVVI
jgi:hypothetical protein